MRKTRPSGAQLNGVSSGGIVGTPTSLPTKWKLLRGYLVGPGALTNANLANADLAGTDVAGANLPAPLSNATSGGIDGTPESLPAGWILVNGYLVGPGAKLVGADLADANLAGIDLSDTDLSGESICPEPT